MRVKEKLIRQKQSATQRSGLVKHTDSTPLLMRLQREYLFNNNNGLKTERQPNYHSKQNKQNRINMINSVPMNCNQYIEANNKIIKIDNYEGKRFKTQGGYIPEMTKSRYEAPSDLSSMEDNAMYSSQEKIILKKDKNKMKQPRYQSVEFHDFQNQKGEYDRPLTFGLIKQSDPLKSSVEYNQERKIKNEAINQISQLRKSQQTLLGSKQYSTDILRCSNHPNKKAKYRLITEFDQKDYEQDMIYCSKCAINLLQRGFKVEEIKHEANVVNSNSQSQKSRPSQNRLKNSKNSQSRLQDIRNFEQNLSQIEEKLNKNVDQASDFQLEIQGIDKDISETESVYDYLLDVLQQMKTLDLQLLTSIKEKKSKIYEEVDKQLITELQNLKLIKKQIRQCRNKYIIMKESDYQHNIQHYLQTISNYGEYNHFYENTHQLDYRKCQINEKVDRIMQSLWGYGKQIEKQEQNKSQLTSALKNHNESGVKDYMKNDQQLFLCEQIQRPPFRTLFPDSDLEEIRNSNPNTHGNQDISMKKNKFGMKPEYPSVKNSGFYENSSSPSFKK